MRYIGIFLLLNIVAYTMYFFDSKRYTYKPWTPWTPIGAAIVLFVWGEAIYWVCKIFIF